MEWARNIVEPIRGAYNTVVGNSISPAMAEGVVDELSGLQTDAGNISKRVGDSISEGMEGAEGPGLGSVETRARRGQQGAGGDTYVDLRHAVMNDDADLRSRVSRAGGNFAGGFS